VLLLHTVVQTVNEVRERCAPLEPAQALALSHIMVPVDIYDEDGNLVSGSESGMNLLPRPRSEQG
jgi:hypothetical protein